jgi:uncharacterized protein YajQ (UPF0234 family)
MPSFDVVSKVPMHEVDNALQQAKKEIATRFDFRDTRTEIDESAEGIVIRSGSEGRLEAGRKVFEEKLVKRGVSLRALDPQKVEPAAKGTYRQVVKIREGISTEKAREIVKLLKDSKLKVQAAILGDQVRVSGKSKDELQAAIRELRGKDFGVDLQFTNFRD